MERAASYSAVGLAPFASVAAFRRRRIAGFYTADAWARYSLRAMIRGPRSRPETYRYRYHVCRSLAWLSAGNSRRTR